MEKALLLIMDGLGDDAHPTPLQNARKNHMDMLAASGMCGYFHAISPGIAPGSGTAHLSLFGEDVETEYPGRGVFEALGAGLTLTENDVAFRGNFCTVKNGVVVDRRAGRIPSEDVKPLIKAIDGYEYEGVVFHIYPGTNYRAVVVATGKDIGKNVNATDPHETGLPVRECKGTDKPSKKLAKAINAFTSFVYKTLKDHPVNKERVKQGKLPGNMLLLRGAGKMKNITSLFQKLDVKCACVAGAPLYKGVAKYVGMDVLKVKGATGDKHTDIHAKAEAVKKALKTNDLVFMHVKATDSFAHDGDREGKQWMIERVDKEAMAELMKIDDLNIAITGDHTTSCIRKRHTGLPVPLLIYGPHVRQDKCVAFDEISVSKGCLGVLEGHRLIHVLLDLIGKMPEYGS